MNPTVVRIQFGSHLYGTSTPQSDFDFKAVHLPTAKEILLQRVRESISSLRSKSEGEKNLIGEHDEESYSLQRYLALLTQGQTVALDMLFAPAPLETSRIWREIQANKDLLLTSKSAAFVGYCRQQANKYGIKGNRVAAARNATEFFTRAFMVYGTQAKVEDVVHLLDSLLDEHTQIIEQQINSSGDQGKFFECCNRKVAFNSTLKQAAEIITRIHANYGSRAKLAEANEGIDWKALSHAVRVGQEALELMSTGEITFPLRNASDILKIKLGLLPYEQVATMIEDLLFQVEAASATSVLRAEPDLSFVDDLVEKSYREVVTTWM